MTHLQLGLTLEQATDTLLGNEDAFIEPILFDVLLERVHIGIFTSMLTLILLSVIHIRVFGTRNSSMIHASFMGAIVAPLLLLLASFYGVPFVLAWIVSFICWHLCAMFLLSSIVFGLIKR